MRLRVRALASLSGLGIWRCRELWCRPAAVASVGPLAWEPPCAAGVALEKTKKKKKKDKESLNSITNCVLGSGRTRRMNKTKVFALSFYVEDKGEQMFSSMVKTMQEACVQERILHNPMPLQRSGNGFKM